MVGHCGTHAIANFGIYNIANRGTYMAGIFVANLECRGTKSSQPIFAVRQDNNSIILS